MLYESTNGEESRLIFYTWVGVIVFLATHSDFETRTISWDVNPPAIAIWDVACVE